MQLTSMALDVTGKFSILFHSISLSDEQRFRFNGTEVLWTNWKDETQNQEEDCGLFDKNNFIERGKWIKWGCTWDANIVCERAYGVPATTVQPATQPGKNLQIF